MRVEILGTGCAKCRALAANTEKAIAELGLDCELVKVTDLDAIASRGVMMTPALALDGTVKVMGRVAGPAEIHGWLAARAETTGSTQGAAGS